MKQPLIFACAILLAGCSRRSDPVHGGTTMDHVTGCRSPTDAEGCRVADDVAKEGVSLVPPVDFTEVHLPGVTHASISGHVDVAKWETLARYTPQMSSSFRVGVYFHDPRRLHPRTLQPLGEFTRCNLYFHAVRTSAGIVKFDIPDDGSDAVVGTLALQPLQVTELHEGSATTTTDLMFQVRMEGEAVVIEVQSPHRAWEYDEDIDVRFLQDGRTDEQRHAMRAHIVEGDR